MIRLGALAGAAVLAVSLSAPAGAAQQLPPRFVFDSGTDVGVVRAVHSPGQNVRISWGDGTSTRITDCRIRQSSGRCLAVARHTFRHEGSASVRVTVGRRSLVVGTVTLPVAVGSTEPSPSPSDERDSRQLPASWRSDMLTSVNAQRSGVGVSALRACPRLDDVAQAYAQTMATRNHYGHSGPDGSTPWDRMRAGGYDYRSAAENIAAGYDSVTAVQRGWIDSPGHFQNMVNGGLQDVGFGYAYSPDSDYGTYWVQVFGAGGAC